MYNDFFTQVKYNNSKINFLLPLLFFVSMGLAQVDSNSKDSTAGPSFSSNEGRTESRKIYKRKGNFYFSWGYNQAFYSKSNIRFWGEGYDFTISDVTGTGHFHYDFATYVQPGTFTIPQYNERFGYFVTDKFFITLGHDHMKYTLDRQTTLLNGTINSGSNSGTYNNTEILVGDNSESGVYQSSLVNTLPHGFVKEFEHCDGLNDFSLELGRLEQLWIAKSGKHALSVQGTVGSGMVIPDTDADVLEYEASHSMGTDKKSFHLAGYSFSASAGLQLDLFKHFFILGKLKTGYINLPDIKTTVEGGKASQHFSFLEPIVFVGYTHCIYKR